MVEYGKKSFGWKFEGILLSIPNVKLGDFIQSSENDKDIISGIVGQSHQDVVIDMIHPSSSSPAKVEMNISSPITSKPKLSPQKTQNLTDEQKVQKLVDMGFSQERAFDALFQTKGDVVAASNLLMDTLEKTKSPTNNALKDPSTKLQPESSSSSSSNSASSLFG